MIQTMYVLMTASGLMLACVGVNEMTHGGLAEGMGLGHHHMTDYGGHHCSGPDDPEWEHHQEHMHNGDDGDHCSGGHMGDGHMGDGHHGA